MAICRRTPIVSLRFAAPRRLWAAPIPRISLRIASVMVVLVGGLVGMATARAGDGSVDLTPAVMIGNFAISQYLVDQHYRRFLAQHQDGSPSAQEKERWWRLFLAQETLAVSLWRDGQLERPDIKAAVAQMSQDTLTSPEGAFYRSLYAQARDRRTHAGVRAEGAEINLAEVRRERRKAVLAQHEFTLHPKAVAALGERLRSVQGDRISAAVIAGIEARALASYRTEGRSCEIIVHEMSVRDFAARVNRRTSPTIPTDLAALSTTIQDFFVADMDEQEAIQAGLDRDPALVQDRLDFALTALRARYERERLDEWQNAADAGRADSGRAPADHDSVPEAAASPAALRAKLDDFELAQFGQMAEVVRVLVDLSRYDLRG